jgi:replicative DNA helicase
VNEQEPPEVGADRLPPFSLEAEEAVLCAVLVDPPAIALLSLTPEDFYRQGHRTIYAAMLAVHARKQAPDIVSVVVELERMGELEAIGGAAMLARLDGGTSVYVEQYAAIVKRKAVMRRLIAAAGRIAALGYEDGADTRERAEAALAAVWEC